MLDASYIKQKFLSEFNELRLWGDDLLKEMSHHEKPTTAAEVNVLRDLHTERKIEIDRREPVFQNLFGFQSKSGRKDEDVEGSQNALHELRDMLVTAWEEENERLLYENRLLEFKLHADQIDSWLIAKEAFLNNIDQSENPRTVELLIRKHQAFEKTLSQQIVKVDDFKVVSTLLFKQSSV